MTQQIFWYIFQQFLERNKFLMVSIQLLFEVLYEMTEKAEDIEKMLKLFFNAGVTPEFAENYLEANALTGGLELFFVFFHFKIP